MSVNTMTILEQLQALSPQETQDLVKQIEIVFDVEATPKITFAYSPDPINLDSTDPVIQTEFDIILEEVPTEKKIAVLKALRETTGLTLKECKTLVEAIPIAVKQGFSKEAAEEVKTHLESVGAKVALR